MDTCEDVTFIRLMYPPSERHVCNYFTGNRQELTVLAAGEKITCKVINSPL